MRTLSIIFLFVLSSLAYGQKAMSFQEASEKGILSELNNTYQSGGNVDTSLAVFKADQQEQYLASYKKLLQDLGKYLKTNHFYWEKVTRGMNRIYFNKDGSIDYFLYSFNPPEQLTKEQEEKFKELLNKFIANYKFPLTAKVKFAQCSPVTFMPTQPDTEQSNKQK